jgi:hypothetical protein
MAAGKLLIVLVGASVLLFGQQKSSVSGAGQAGMKPGEVFRDRLKNGSEGPEMVVIPPGKFRMGDIQGSQATVKALRTIKFCALSIIGFVAVGELFIVLGNSDDRAGGIFMGILITFGSVVIATAAAMFERILQNAADIRSENDLTVNEKTIGKFIK